MNKYDTRRFRLIEIRDNFCGGSITEVARKANLAPSYVGRMLYPEGKAGKKNIGEDLARRVEMAFHLMPGWLDQVEDRVVIDKHHVPIIPFDLAPQYAKLAQTNWKEYISTALALSSGAFATRIEENSMSPEFKENDFIFVEPNMMPSPGDYVIAVVENQKTMCRKYRLRGINDKHGASLFALIPINSQDYETLQSDSVSIKIIGVVVEHHRVLRPLS